jgi:murein DD-endopeptidase MepM/ murein hydrolase activator NlpD
VLLTAIALAAMVALLPASAAADCDALVGNAGVPPVKIRKPVQGEDVRLTTGFGPRFHPLLNGRRMHTGVDWAAPRDTSVIAAGGGQIISTRVDGELGNTVVIAHGSAWETLYGHLARIDVREGDCVAFGTVIGGVGATGLASGPMLHFELHRDGQPIDPMSIRVEGDEPLGEEGP